MSFMSCSWCSKGKLGDYPTDLRHQPIFEPPYSTKSSKFLSTTFASVGPFQRFLLLNSPWNKRIMLKPTHLSKRIHFTSNSLGHKWKFCSSRQTSTNFEPFTDLNPSARMHEVLTWPLPTLQSVSCGWLGSGSQLAKIPTSMKRTGGNAFSAQWKPITHMNIST